MRYRNRHVLDRGDRIFIIMSVVIGLGLAVGSIAAAYKIHTNDIPQNYISIKVLDRYH